MGFEYSQDLRDLIDEKYKHVMQSDYDKILLALINDEYKYVKDSHVCIAEEVERIGAIASQTDDEREKAFLAILVDFAHRQQLHLEQLEELSNRCKPLKVKIEPQPIRQKTFDEWVEEAEHEDYEPTLYAVNG